MRTIFCTSILLLFLLACDKNTPTPDYEVIGDAYATFAEFTVDNNEPIAGEVITFELDYANYQEDPLTYIEFFERSGETSTSIQRFDETGTGFGQFTKTVIYSTDISQGGSSIEIYVELHSAKEFPQVELIAIEILE